MSVPDVLERAGRRFARLATRASLAHPLLGRLVRRPLRAQFNRLAPYWEGRRGPESLLPLEAALELLEEVPRRVLDVGTGTGKAARLLAERFPDADVVGVDQAEAMVAEARRLGGGVRYEAADAAALPFEEGAFDLVVLLNMIPFVGELGRVTAPRGRLVVAFSSGPATPIWVPPDVLRERLERAGFGAFADVAAGEGTAVVATRL